MISQLVGNELNEKMLAAFKGGGRFPHCIIISGGAGSGKRSLASEIAAAYLCSAEVLEDKSFCGVCNDCRMALGTIHPDVEYIRAPEDSKTGAINIEQIRNLKSGAALMANQGIGRVFILEDAHKMLAGAANALLKQIEEPVKGTLYILLTESEQLLLETVRSRGVLIRTPSLNNKQCTEVLKKRLPDKDVGELSSLAVIYGNTVGAVLSALEDKNTSDILEGCKALLVQINRYNGFEVAALLKPFEGNRQNYIKLLTTLRLYIYSCLQGGNTNIDTENLVRWVEILAFGVERAKQNVVLSLLSSIIATKLCSRE